MPTRGSTGASDVGTGRHRESQCKTERRWIERQGVTLLAALRESAGQETCYSTPPQVEGFTQAARGRTPGRGGLAPASARSSR